MGQEGLMMARSDLCPELLHSRGHVNKATEPGSPLVIGYGTRGEGKKQMFQVHTGQRRVGNTVEARAEMG